MSATAVVDCGLLIVDYVNRELYSKDTAIIFGESTRDSVPRKTGRGSPGVPPLYPFDSGLIFSPLGLRNGWKQRSYNTLESGRWVEETRSLRT